MKIIFSTDANLVPGSTLIWLAPSLTLSIYIETQTNIVHYTNTEIRTNETIMCAECQHGRNQRELIACRQAHNSQSIPSL